MIQKRVERETLTFNATIDVKELDRQISRYTSKPVKIELDELGISKQLIQFDRVLRTHAQCSGVASGQEFIKNITFNASPVKLGKLVQDTGEAVRTSATRSVGSGTSLFERLVREAETNGTIASQRFGTKVNNAAAAGIGAGFGSLGDVLGTALGTAIGSIAGSIVSAVVNGVKTALNTIKEFMSEYGEVPLLKAYEPQSWQQECL